MPFNVPTAGALKEAADFIMTSTRSSPEASPVFDHHDDSWQVSSYSNYFSTSAAPLDRYTDALVAEIGAATELPVKDRHSLPRLSTLAATAAASHRTELPPPGWRRWRRRRRVTFADEVGLQLERVACRGTDFYSGSGEDSEAGTAHVDASSGVKEDPAADTTVCSIELLQQNLQQLQQQQQQLEFCLCLQRVDPAGSCESVWDNNGGRNYRLKLPVTDLCPVPE
uniref:CBM21 domain-containing protein n=1 Tax=Macrostomum lignano TaxID=282301 RepID=A0A1I8J3E7_9PLAT